MLAGPNNFLFSYHIILLIIFTFVAIDTLQYVVVKTDEKKTKQMRLFTLLLCHQA